MQRQRADFYVNTEEGLEWIGSVLDHGDIWSVPLEILIQINKTTFEESVAEYIQKCGGVVANHPCQWPWAWADSRMTDYSYILVPELEKVFMSIEGGNVLDPISVVQGYSVDESDVQFGPPIFPMMKKEGYEDTHGSKFTASI